MKRYSKQFLSIALSTALAFGGVPAARSVAWAEPSEGATAQTSGTTGAGRNGAAKTPDPQNGTAKATGADQGGTAKAAGAAVAEDASLVAQSDTPLVEENSASPATQSDESLSAQSDMGLTAQSDMGLTAQADKRNVDVTTWAELQAAIDGCQSGETVRIHFKGHITATSSDGPLVVGRGKKIELETQGFNLDRGLTEPKENGYVMRIDPSAEVTIDDDKVQTSEQVSATVIKGGNNIGDGGAFWNAGTLTILRATISGNKSQGNGGGIYNASRAECGWGAVLNAWGPRIIDNEAKGNGGGICNYGSKIVMRGVGNEIAGNVAQGDGGGIFCGSPDGNTDSVQLDLTTYSASCPIEKNTARNGGGLYLNGTLAQKKIPDTYSFTDNTATGNGGGIYITQDFDSNSRVTGNKAQGNGGGVYVDVPTSGRYKQYGEVAQNSAGGNGGGIYLKATGVVVVGRNVYNNTASGNGGGIFVESGSLTVQDRAGLWDNKATSGNGGGIFVGAGAGLMLHGDSCPVTENTAGGQGGGVYVSAGAGDIQVAGNVKVKDNTAAEGTGIYLGGDKKLDCVGEFYGEPFMDVTLERVVGVFTTGFLDKNNKGEGPSSFFGSDDARLAVVWEGREGRLVARSDNIPYVERSWNGSEVVSEDKTCEAAKSLNEAQKMDGGWYLLTDNWTSGKCLQVTEDSSLILTDGLTLQTDGIYIQKGKTLTIYGQTNDTGKIVSQVATGAGIGANPERGAGGNLVVHGGRIEATGGSQGAGIGGADGNEKEVGSFTVYGGSVIAQGGKNGAGIGGGEACEGGSITIYGGTVEATGGARGAGIGGGNGKDKPVRGAHGGTITISGGTVTANGGEDAAGIGGGEGGNAGNITIGGGEVTARGGDNASGIGCGEGESTGVGGTVTISGGTVMATGGNDGAGVGGGEDGHCEKIVISDNATVTATGGLRAAAIGGGNDSDGGTIEVTGDAYVTATAGDRAAGIGSGCDGKGTDNTVRILDRTTVTVYGGNEKNAPIGAGKGKATGTLKIYDHALVTAGTSEAKATKRLYEDRVSACQNVANGYARIEWCTHGDGVEFHDEGRLRVGVCKYCHSEIRGGLGAEPFRIESLEGAPVIDAKNMADVVGVVLDEEEINGGVELLLVSSPLTEVPETDRTALEAKTSELEATAGQWFDVSLYKDYEGNLTPVTEVSVPVALEVEVPESLRAEDRELWLLQSHDEKAREVAKGTGDVLAGDVDGFSTFLIDYKGGTASEGGSSTAPSNGTNGTNSSSTGAKAAATGTTGTGTTTYTTGTKATLAKTADQTLPVFVPVVAGIAIVAAGVLHRRRQNDE